MFDLSFGKLAIIFTLCLLVLGPEKLPKLAAQLGKWTGQARAMARHFREQLEQEIAAEQLLKEKRELEQSIANSVDAAKNIGQAAAQPVNEMTQSVQDAMSADELRTSPAMMHANDVATDIVKPHDSMHEASPSNVADQTAPQPHSTETKSTAA